MYNKELWISTIYVVLLFDRSDTRVLRCYASKKDAKKYQKRLNKKGHITGLIERRFYDKW
jgi:hypothetical protein